VTINGASTSTVTFITDATTHIEGVLAAGAEISAEGTLQADGTIVASEIVVLCPATIP